MIEIPLAHLHAHPSNANRMSAANFNKLRAHLASRGQYPPLIVRPHPTRSGRYELLDGHHRAEALRQLGCETAQCVIWQVDDRQATVLLLTLNRLRGEDDPHTKARLLADLAREADAPELARLLPVSEAEIARLLKLSRPPGSLASPRLAEDMPHAMTFFLTGAQHAAVQSHLAAFSQDRSTALLRALKLETTLETP